MKVLAGKRRRNSVFDVVRNFDKEDVQAKQQQKRLLLDLQRSKAAQSQTKIYSSLLECRILLQRSITTKRQQQLESNTDNTKNNTFIEELNNLLSNLLRARKMLQTKQQLDESSFEYKKIAQQVDGNELHLNDVLESEYQSCREEWKEVFNQRHKDVRLHAGLVSSKSTQFRVMDSSFWEQVESTVQYEQERIPSTHPMENNQAVEDGNKTIITPETDSSITTITTFHFDDAKVYQQLLKDFVTSSSSQTGRDQIAAAQQRVLKKQRKAGESTSMKSASVDRRASKGRKIRYTEIPKLQNFTFPLSRPRIDDQVGTTLNQDEWFASLFGGKHSWKKSTYCH